MYNNNFAAVCDNGCGTNMECTQPNNCTCIGGWSGYDCLTGIGSV